MRGSRAGRLLVVAGIVLFVGSMATSAALAPDIGLGGPRTPETVVGIQGGGLGLHEYGRVTMYNGTNVTWQATTADSYFDVTTTGDGTVVAAFVNGSPGGCDPFDPPCGRTGIHRIDPTPNALTGVGVATVYNFSVRTVTNSEVHDVEPLGDDGYVVADMEYERIFVVDDGNVVWQWNASRLYDPPADPRKRDWLHINDVDVIGEGRYLVSVRNANQILVLERGEGVTEIINRDTDDGNDGDCTRRQQLQDTDGDGSVRCGDPTVFRHQHNPQWLGDGAVLVADSENDRIVELHRTENGSWVPVWSLASARGVEFQWPRDADRLPNGNTLITDTHNRRIVEVNQSGAVVWSVETEYLPYEADRVAHGESPDELPRYATGERTEATATATDTSPVLSGLVADARGAWPRLPFWFQETQMLMTLLSLGLVCVGVLVSLAGRLR